MAESAHWARDSKAALRGYCKMARSAMGGARKADEQAARQARRKGGESRKAAALEFRAEKKRLLSELENRLILTAARSRKAGQVVRV